MNLLSVATLVAAVDRSAVTLDPARCLRASDKFSTCDACLQACPASALEQGNPLSLDGERCARCYLCLHLCPVGAFGGDDGVAQLLDCVAHLPEESAIVELACRMHPSAEIGPPGTDAVIRTKGCLAALGPSAYLSILALGATRVVARLDACGNCPLRAVVPRIEETLATAQMILAGMGGEGRVLALEDPDGDGATDRPTYDAARLTRSRRDLFRMAATASRQLAARALAEGEPVPQGEKGPPHERRRLVVALASLARDRTVQAEHSLDGFAAGQLGVDERCTACGACARACPAGALRLAVTDDARYQLTFSPWACTDCGVCLDFCEPGALRREGPVSLLDLLDLRPILLRTGVARRCARCGATFAGETPSGLCRPCDFRRQNPFGSRRPVGNVPMPGAVNAEPGVGDRGTPGPDAFRNRVR